MFCHKLEEALNIRNLNYADLGRKTGLAKGTISHYASGRNLPNATNIKKIADALNVSEAWLMGYDVPMERKNPETAAEKVSEIESLFKLLSPEQQQTVIALIHQLAKK